MAFSDEYYQPMTDKSKQKRRRFYFVLCSLLALVALPTMASYWYTAEMANAARRRAAIGEIERLGGEVGYYDPERSADTFSYPCGEPPEWFSVLRKWHGDEMLGLPVYVRLVATPTTDDDLVHLKELTELKWLWLGDTDVTDAGMVHLEGLTKLQWLGMPGTGVTDEGLVHLKGLKELRRLELYDALITDAGLAHLTGLKNLEWLDFYETDVSDAGLESLKGLKKLERLELHDTAVTPDGVERFKEALPDCVINY